MAWILRILNWRVDIGDLSLQPRAPTIFHLPLVCQTIVTPQLLILDSDTLPRGRRRPDPTTRVDHRQSISTPTSLLPLRRRTSRTRSIWRHYWCEYTADLQVRNSPVTSAVVPCPPVLTYHPRLQARSFPHRGKLISPRRSRFTKLKWKTRPTKSRNLTAWEDKKLKQ